MPKLVDEVAVLEAGRLTQHGPLAEIAQAPQTAFAARFFGTAAQSDGLDKE